LKFRSWKRREESRSVKLARAEGRDDSIVIAGRWQALQLTSDHGSRARSQSLLRRLRCLSVKLRIWGQEFESLRARHFGSTACIANSVATTGVATRSRFPI
jgi:hypothetical protein